MLQIPMASIPQGFWILYDPGANKSSHPDRRRLVRVGSNYGSSALISSSAFWDLGVIEHLKGLTWLIQHK